PEPPAPASLVELPAPVGPEVDPAALGAVVLGPVSVAPPPSPPCFAGCRLSSDSAGALPSGGDPATAPAVALTATVNRGPVRTKHTRASVAPMPGACGEEAPRGAAA